MMDTTSLYLMLLWLILAQVADQPLKGIAWFSATFCALIGIGEISQKIMEILS